MHDHGSCVKDWSDRLNFIMMARTSKLLTDDTYNIKCEKYICTICIFFFFIGLPRPNLEMSMTNRSNCFHQYNVYI